MAVFKWQGGSLGADEGRDQVASDWRDLTTGKSGGQRAGQRRHVQHSGHLQRRNFPAGCALSFPGGQRLHAGPSVCTADERAAADRSEQHCRLHAAGPG